MKVNFEELSKLSYEAGEKLLLEAGYVHSGPGTTEAVVSDYALDEYFTLFNDTGDSEDVISYSWFYNKKPGKAEDEEDVLVKEGWNHICEEKKETPITRERAMDLLNVMIDYEFVGERCDEVIRHLLSIGFTSDELVQLHFDPADIEEVEKEIENEDEED